MSQMINQSQLRATDDGVMMTNMRVVRMLSIAFGMPEERILGLPVWAETDRYDMQVKVDDADLAQWRTSEIAQKKAFQEFFASRFALKAHLETRELEVLSLVVARDKPKFCEATPGDKYLNGRKNRDGTPSGPGIWTKPGQIMIQGTGMGELVDLLESRLVHRFGYPIEDRAGLAGTYDLTLEWMPSAKGADDANASFFIALEEQLGLKLKPGKGKIEAFVVEHIEKPAPN